MQIANIQQYLHDLTDADMTSDEKREAGAGHILELMEDTEDSLADLARAVVPPGFQGLLESVLDSEPVDRIQETLANAVNDAIWLVFVKPGIIRSRALAERGGVPASG